LNFFRDQEIAKKKTRKLVVLFLASVVATGATLTFVVGYIFEVYMQSNTRGAYEPIDMWSNVDKHFLLFLVVCITILMATFYKILNLGKGGDYVARLLGATPVKRANSDPDLKKYINIVEEMSIASGCPVPKIYIMEHETSINAFAAGYEIDDCIICVTRGAIEKLSRDELQGVVAHEFSHIFNGDMKLSIKLIGYLFGLLILTQVGRVILQSGRYRTRSNRGKDGNGIVFVGLAFFIIGGIGYLLGSLIKSSISKQREYLADASAVQFTRNPFGIGGALLKINKLIEGSTIMANKAEEVSHLFFGAPMKMSFASHPSLENRLKRIYPKKKWEEIEKMEVKYPEKRVQGPEKEKAEVNDIFNNDALKIATAGTVLSSLADRKDHIGEITEVNVEAAKNILNSIPFSIKDKIQTTDGAKQIILSFFNGTSEFRDSWRFAIFEVALGTLRELSLQEKKEFIKKAKKLVLEDQLITPSEFIHYYIVKKMLLEDRGFYEKKISKSEAESSLLSLVEFTRGGLNNDSFKFKPSEIAKALDTLSRGSLSVKERVLNKLIEVVNEDERISVLEEEFIRLVCQGFRVPFPL
jgi:Zn-dependent protease with chaperone function